MKVWVIALLALGACTLPPSKRDYVKGYINLCHESGCDKKNECGAFREINPYGEGPEVLYVTSECERVYLREKEDRDIRKKYGQ